MTLKRRITTAVATGALIFNAFAQSAFAATTIEISGNGTNSDNDSNVGISQTTTVVQSNNADVFNKVDVDADTGGNDANDNTGGDVSVETVDVDTEVNVSNALNSNSANVDCCLSDGDTEVLISGNGSNSDNTVNLGQTNYNAIYQSNDADVTNLVDVDGDTGDNDAEDNTGGDVSVETGDVDTKVSISTAANANSASISGDGNGGGTLSARIVGNGTHSDNDINLGLLSGVLISQDNNADVFNKVDVDADTGNNDANDNTGGEVSITTGDVDTEVEIDNMVNFNFADADCGCLLEDILAKISGNGSDSDSTINASLEDKLEVFQSNCDDQYEWWYWWNKDCEIENKVDVDGDTGDNDAEDNTGGVHGGDPSVDTGDVDTNVDLDNSGNVNVYGDDSGLEFPDFDFDLDISIDLGDLLDFLMGNA